MAVFLMILKILGIILLCIIGLVLLIVLLALFAPVRYKVNGAYGEEIGGKVNVRWLFASVAATGGKKEKGMDVVAKIKVFGIPIKKMVIMGENDSKDRKKKLNKKKKKDDTGTDASLTQETSLDPLDQTIPSTGLGENTPTGLNPDEEPLNLTADDFFADEKEVKKNQKKAKKAKKKEKKKDKNPEGEKEKKTIGERIEAISDKIYDTTDKIAEKKDSLAVKKNHIFEFLDRPYVKNTIKRGKKLIKKVFKNILPRKGDVNVILGLKSPDKTGEITGKIYMFYPLFYKWLHLTPEFHEKKIEADVKCKGRIYIGSMAIPAALLYFSKDFKKTMNLAKKI
ncbi:MAG: hypothetical protein K6C35_01565 [Eubacterium sp.]|nr:hypothetical protein [Eubacterium sp.]